MAKGASDKMEENNADDIRGSYVRDSRRLEAQLRPWIEKQVYEKVRALRRGYSLMVYVDIQVLVPVCVDCIYSEYRFLEEPQPRPDVHGTQWKRDYALMGFSKRQIKEVGLALKEGWWQLRCYRCGTAIDPGQGDSFYVRREGPSDYFDLKIAKGGRVRKGMRGSVLEAFGNRCAGCRKELSPGEATMDHIVAKSEGGSTDLLNLQPLCLECNQKKANRGVDNVGIDLTFPLRPPPSDGYEEVIW
jgi:5-methylcytosine-specific restriction endonuclease McrA